jgi:uncharacterized membrane protein YccC
VKEAGLTIHDPGRLALRRGIRLAIGTPIILVVLLHVLSDPIGIPFGLFFLTSAVGTADFAGTAKVRLLACLVSGAVCVPVIVIGMASTFNLFLLVLVTLVLGFFLFFVGVLRGLVAAGAPIVISQLAVAVTSSATLEQLPSILTGLTTGALVSALCLLFVLPTDRRRHVRDGIAGALDAMSHLARLAWGDLSNNAALKAAEQDVQEAVSAVHREFGGQPFRPAGVSRRDRALMQLVVRVRVLRQMQLVLVRQARSIIPGTRALGMNSGNAMETSARALHDSSAPLPDIAVFPQLIDTHYDSCTEWVMAQAAAHTSADTIVAELQRAHATRVVSMLTAQVAGLVYDVRGAAIDPMNDRTEQVRPWWRDLILNANTHSPWLFSAVRGSVAIAIGAGVVHFAGITYGLWVLLGVIAVLRVDVLSTRRAAWQVVWGTAVGATVGTGVILFADVTNWQWLLWVLLPATALIVGWAPGSLGSVAVSQTAFSAMVLIAFAIIEWPTDLILGLTRLENMGLGALVAILCAVLMWPRGVMGFLGRTTATAVRSCARLALTAVSVLAGDVSIEKIDALESKARLDLSNSTEAIDLALVQRGTGSRLGPWMRVGDSTRALMSYGKLLTHIVQRETVTLPASLKSAVLTSQHASELVWNQLATECSTAQPTSLPLDAVDASEPLPVDLSQVLTAADDLDLTIRTNATALCISVWAIDWLHLLNQLSDDARNSLISNSQAVASSALATSPK